MDNLDHCDEGSDVARYSLTNVMPKQHLKKEQSSVYNDAHVAFSVRMSWRATALKIDELYLDYLLLPNSKG